MTDHPIAPPPLELVHQWADMLASRSDQAVFTMAVQYGADQELEACCEWLCEDSIPNTSNRLRAARRPSPTPPSLKERALQLLKTYNTSGVMLTADQADTIRRALEALDD